MKVWFCTLIIQLLPEAVLLGKGNGIPGVAALPSSLIPQHHVVLLTLQEQETLHCSDYLSVGSAMNHCTPLSAADPTAIISLVSAASKN